MHLLLRRLEEFHENASWLTHATHAMTVPVSPPKVRLEWIGRPEPSRQPSGSAHTFQNDRSIASSEPDWVGVCCSRLGQSACRRRLVCQQITKLWMDPRHQATRLVVMAGSALDPWVCRAAWLYRQPLLRVTFENAEWRRGHWKDLALIHASDFVDALYVRRNGKLAKCIADRIETDPGFGIRSRIAVTNLDDCGAQDLLRKGAIGRWISTAKGARLTDDASRIDGDETQEPSLSTPPAPRCAGNTAETHSGADSLGWIKDEHTWLIHCTRGRDTSWPRESCRQWMDDWLINGTNPQDAMASLMRIIRGRRLVGSAITSNHTFPVVCFAGLSLKRLLASRCYRSHLRRWDYEPFGVAIRREAAVQMGARPVIYGETPLKKHLSVEDKPFFQSRGKTHDWTWENEYRWVGDVDLNPFSRRDVRVFVPSEVQASLLRPHCPWAISLVGDILPN